MKVISYLNRAIEYSFYSLFILVPLVFTGNTSELFEFNKIWVTFIVTILIGFFWFTKMILLKRVVFKRTIFDIPILLFLISQIISTVISIDPYVSLWGYYSRWNGGLFSIITYIFLYYAFVSNFWNNAQVESVNKKIEALYDPSGITIVKRSLLVSLIAGFLVILWSLPSHFGFDPTCLIFRGSLDVACWTADFQPKIRIFGPLGQPAWLAGYLGVLLPIAAAFVILRLKEIKNYLDPKLIFYSSSFILFLLALLYTGSRAGAIATLISLFIFFAVYLLINRKNLGFLKNKFSVVFIILTISVVFTAGIPLPVFEKFSLDKVRILLVKKPAIENQVANPNIPVPKQVEENQSTRPVPAGIELGGSNSSKIRIIVWEGAIGVWKANPIFGSGVETFAYSYYQHRPIAHNTLSEWNFLYNKAHNEYLNYLATTGIVGLLTYLAFVLFFVIFAALNSINTKFKPLKFLQSENTNSKDPLILSLLTSFLSILIINFFGFSVTILNIYLLLIPAFALILLSFFKQTEIKYPKFLYVSYSQWIGVFIIGLIGTGMIIFLARYWIADTSYALGANYNNVAQYQTAYPLLQNAIKTRREPVFLNEVAINDAVIAAGLAKQGGSESAQMAQTLAQESLTVSEKLTQDYPHNIVFWKGRVRVLYTLANIDPRFSPLALEAIKKAAELAPTDATILYNLGVLYGQNSDSIKAVEVLEKVVNYRPAYQEARFALGLFYHDLSVDKNGKIIDDIMHQKAIEQMNALLVINPNNQQAKDSITAWNLER